MTTSASWHATTTIQVRPDPHQRPLVKPDVRRYRIRLTDDLSAQSIRRKLTAVPLQVDQPLGPQGLIPRRPFQLPTTPLAPRPEKATQPSLHVPVHLFEGHAGISKAKVIPPAKQIPIQLADYVGKRLLHPPLGHLPQSVPHSAHGMGRGHDVEIPAAAPPMAVKPKSKAQKVQACTRLTQVNDPGLVPVQAQPQSLQYLIHKIHHPCPDDSGQNDKIIRIPHQPGLNRPCRTNWTVELPIQFMKKDIGQERRNDSPNAKDNLACPPFLIPRMVLGYP